LNDPISEDKLAAVKQLLFQGRKIEAIKLHRESTGAGLAESKTAVDALEKELREKSPENFAPTTDRRGCLGLVVLLCAIGALLILRVIFR
jgi:ribosomal protein L7/L12